MPEDLAVLKDTRWLGKALMALDIRKSNASSRLRLYGVYNRWYDLSPKFVADVIASRTEVDDAPAQAYPGTEIRAADLVVIPIRPGPFDINAAAGTVEIMKQTGRPGIFVLSQVAAVGPEGDDTAAVLQELYPDVPVAKARLGQRKAFMQALISGQAITEFDRPSSKAVGEIKALFREVRAAIKAP